MPRTFLVHLHVEAPDDDGRDADAIADAIADAVEVGSGRKRLRAEHFDSLRGVTLAVTLAEEV